MRKSFVPLAVLLLSSVARPFTTVELSTGAPESVEQAFIASTTAQFNVNLTTNPFFRNTFHMTLLGPNPSYNPPLTNKDLLNALVTVDSYTYVYGWADGMTTQQYNDFSQSLSYTVLCSSPALFTQWGSTTPWDTGTCQTTANAIAESIFQQHLSSPTPVPGGF